MSMADKRDKTSYIINNPIKKLLNDHGYMLNRIGLMDAYHKGVLIQMLEEKENQ